MEYASTESIPLRSSSSSSLSVPTGSGLLERYERQYSGWVPNAPQLGGTAKAGAHAQQQQRRVVPPGKEAAQQLRKLTGNAIDAAERAMDCAVEMLEKGGF